MTDAREPAREEGPVRIDRILWNDEGGDIDEIVLHNVTVHVEQMDKRCWWIGVYKGDTAEDPYWMGNFTCDSRGRMTFTEQENAGIEWDIERAHSGHTRGEGGTP